MNFFKNLNKTGKIVLLIGGIIILGLLLTFGLDVSPRGLND